MFALKLRGKFGVFRDPLTITQNITLPIPPKTTIGGILAAIKGLNYHDYFADEEYFNFKYSLVLLKEIRKKSFCQNYVTDYTVKSEKKLKAFYNVEKDITKIIEKMASPQPIFREILIDPEYLIFVHEYKYEDEIIQLLEKHQSRYPLYMGNSEFAANYEFIKCVSVKEKQVDLIHSFTRQSDKIKFESGKKYSKVHAAMRVTGNREYRDYKDIIVSNEKICFIKDVSCLAIKTQYGEFNCEFI